MEWYLLKIKDPRTNLQSLKQTIESSHCIGGDEIPLNGNSRSIVRNIAIREPIM